MKKIKNLSIILALSLCISAIYPGTAKAQAAADASPSVSETTESQDPLSLREARYLIQNYYIDGVSNDILNSSSVPDMVKGLNDPYSTYFTKQEYEDFVGRINNSFCGIGVYIKSVPEGIKVTDIIKGSPAEGLGLKAGDIIIKAAGHNLAGLTADVASSYLKGPENTSVSFEILRDGKKYDYIAVRKMINAPTVLGNIYNDNVAYISIQSFGENTADEFNNMLQNLKKSNPDYYVIDLRDDGGGYMDSCFDIASYFVGDKPIVKLEDKAGNTEIINGVNKGETIDKPIYFLVNENTASASEILSAAVKDYKKAFFIGSTTYGKGCAQNMYQLSDGSVIKLTVMKFYSPLGNTIQKVGINSDFTVYDDIDSLAAALLLSGSSGNNADKTGFVKVRVSGQDFEINLSLARKKNYEDAFKYIIKRSDTANSYLGTSRGWEGISASLLLNPDLLERADYTKLAVLEDVSSDKNFDIHFNSAVDLSTITKDDLKLFDEITGKTLDYALIPQTANSFQIIPKAELTTGHRYDIFIDEGIKGKNGESLGKGIITTSTVK